MPNTQSVTHANGYDVVHDHLDRLGAKIEAVLAERDELLAALRAFVQLYDGAQDLLGPSVRNLLARAEAAIAKAEGGK